MPHAKSQMRINQKIMKKLALLLMLTFVIQTEASSQSCIPDGITFYTQESIDNFQVDYPNCTEIEGYVEISGDIYNLNGLSVLTNIGEYLNIHHNNQLASLSGLDNLNTIGGDLTIWGNNTLTSLTGFNNLTSIGGNIQIKDNYALTSLMGFESLTSVWDLTISNNTNLGSLAGLDNVTTIDSYLTIMSQLTLTNIEGLNSLTFIGGNLNILDNYSLINLSGLNNLTSIGNGIEIFDNPVLTSLDALANLTSIANELYIATNNSLVSLEGLDNIDANSIQQLLILYNPSLYMCEVRSVCDYLASPNGTISINSNESGCNTQAEIEEACISIDVLEVIPESEFIVYPNPAKNKISIICSNELAIDEISIYNQLGQKVLHNNNDNNINISTLVQGFYIVELISGNFRVRQKLRIE